MHTVVAHGVVVLVDRAWPGWLVVARHGVEQALLTTILAPWMFRFVHWERRLVGLA